MAGVVLTLAVEPATISKRLVKALVSKKGHPFPVWPKVGKRVIDKLKGDAFSLGVATMEGPVVVGVVAYWREPWGPNDHERAPGMARGDVDAPLSVVLDALKQAGVYRDDAWVGATMAAKAVDARDPRIECFVGPLTPDVLGWMGRRLALDVPMSRVLVGGQQEALL